MRNQSFSKIWIVIILVILIGGGIFAWQYFRVSEEKIVPGEEVIEDETIDWKEYTSDIFKILLKYPSDFNLIEDNTSGVIDRAFEIRGQDKGEGKRTQGNSKVIFIEKICSKRVIKLYTTIVAINNIKLLVVIKG